MKSESPLVNFPEREREVLEFWKTHQVFEKSLQQRQGAEPFLFYDGPPFATGLPHYGHLLQGTIKDIFPRYQTMKGKYVERRFGWDTHGLPVEMLVEKELGLRGSQDIQAHGVANFNEACRASVLRYVAEWRKTTERLGRWIDFDNDYKTMDPWFMESVWWVFKQLWEQGRVYEGARVVPYSWRLSTPLSNFEASANYKDVQDPAITVAFPVIGRENHFLLAWTTTPWTLPSNLALCVGPDIDYVELSRSTDESEPVYIVAEALVEKVFGASAELHIHKSYKGSALQGLRYKPLFDFYADLGEVGAFQVLVDGYVSTEDGTGVVHQSPAHGEDDFRVCQAAGLPLVDPVDAFGNFTDVAGPFSGKNIKEADKDIIQALKEKQLLFKQDTLSHSYPFCERSDTPLIFKAISAWYVRVEDLREQMLANNSTIRWVPEHIRDGRFGNWLANARDWNISRNRFWGNPLPIWKCSGCEHVECFGAKAELEERVGKEVPDLHKHFLDELTFTCDSCAGEMRRTPEVLDCWFESGAMPYAFLHYPFENQEKFEANFPADFIGEALDQTRGWFYTLMVLSTALFDRAPFRNCIVSGMILAEDGKKMSKSLKNYPDPSYVLEEYGADALRLYMTSSPLVRGESLRFSESGVKEIVRSVLLPYWNVYSFFTTYAEIDGFLPDEISHPNSDNDLDRWIVSRLESLLGKIELEMSEYRLYTVISGLLEFLDDLTNWYLRRSRRRFWSDDAEDKRHGYQTLHYVLVQFSRAMAPFLPFVTETVYRNLTESCRETPESVHLSDYPLPNEALRDEQLEAAMEVVRLAVKLGRSLRSRLDLKVRQPLRSITLVTRDTGLEELLRDAKSHIEEELNVKEVLFRSDEENFVDLRIKPQFPLLGPIFGKEMKECAAVISKFTLDDVLELEQGRTREVLGRPVGLEHIEVSRSSKGTEEIETGGGLTVFFDCTLDTELVQEGLARELVNRIQRGRKEAGFEISDRIETQVSFPPEAMEAFRRFESYIKEETLSVAFLLVDAASDDGAEYRETLSLEGQEGTILLRRIRE